MGAWAGGRSPPAAAGPRAPAPARGSAAPAPGGLSAPPGGGPGTRRGHLSLRDPRRGRGRGGPGSGKGAPGTRAPGTGRRRGPTWLLRRWRCSRSCCSVSSYRHRTSRSCSLSRLGVGDGVRAARSLPYCSPQPAPAPALTAAAPAPGRLALGPPPPGRPTPASEGPPSTPAARGARAAAGSRAAAPPAAWKEGRAGAEAEVGAPRRPEMTSAAPGQPGALAASGAFLSRVPSPLPGVCVCAAGLAARGRV